MSQTIPDITIPSGDYISINTTLNVPTGVAMQLQLKSTGTIRLQESNTKPNASSDDGIILTDLYGNYAVADITSGSLEIWAKSSIYPMKLSVVVK